MYNFPICSYTCWFTICIFLWFLLRSFASHCSWPGEWCLWGHLPKLTASCWIEFSLKNYAMTWIMCIIIIRMYFKTSERNRGSSPPNVQKCKCQTLQTSNTDDVIWVHKLMVVPPPEWTGPQTHMSKHKLDLLTFLLCLTNNQQCVIAQEKAVETHCYPMTGAKCALNIMKERGLCGHEMY